jgi:DNA gyrase subunit A
MLPLREFADDKFVFLATESGTVKKTSLTAFEKIRSTGIKAITIDEGDKLVGAALTTKNDDVLLTSAKGLAVRFSDEKVRQMGRDARGVRGINLREGDRLVGMCTFARDSAATLVTMCERGYGKRSPLSDYPTKNRGGKGVIGIKTTTRNGNLTAVRIVAEEDHLILISDKGKLIRIRVKDIPTLSRATQGVRIMRLDDGEIVAAIERLADPGEETGIAEAAPIEAMDESDTLPVEAEGDIIEEDDDDDAGDDEAGDDSAE